MDNLEYYKQNVNQIFTCLSQLETYLDDQDNNVAINGLNEYKNELISFSQLISENKSINSVDVDNSNNNTEAGALK